MNDDMIVRVAKELLSNAKTIAQCEWTKCRYGENLASALESLGGLVVLKENFENDYQGFVDVDVLLSDGRIFSYSYSYGSCSGCDTWEAKGYTDEEVIQEMKETATYFNNTEEYEAWLKIRK